MRDAAKGKEGLREPIAVLPPDPKLSGVGWQPVGKRGRKGGGEGLLAGLEQVPGIGEKTATAMAAYREEHGIAKWDDYAAVKGIGPKTIETIRSFADREDPFNIYGIDQMLTTVRTAIQDEELGDVPMPTHTALEVPYERGDDVPIVFLGVPVDRNLRDIFESNRARTGVELKRSEVRQPDLNEWVMILCTDGDEQVTIRVDRFRYRKFRDMVWGARLGRDLLLVEGKKPGFRTAREIYVRKMWVIDPEED
jgi:hypothetical protein